MNYTPRITLKFSCNQNWDEMTPNKEGRYCVLCKKNIIDFTHNSIPEIQSYSIGKNDICGGFSIEQLEPDLVSASKLVSPVKKFIILVLSFISFEMAGRNQDSKEKHKTEQISSDTNLIMQSDKSKTRKNHKLQNFCSEDYAYPSESSSTKSLRIFFSKRFPFIHFRKRRIYPGYMAI